MKATQPARDEAKPSPAKRADSDQAYVVKLIAEILGQDPMEEHRFDWLRGDTGVALPVDAYFPTAGIVVEYRERQHLADRADTFKLWDNKPTASGIPRREQRARYDGLRDKEIPAHGLRLVVVTSDDLEHNDRGRLLRERSSDLETLREMLDAPGRGASISSTDP